MIYFTNGLDPTPRSRPVFNFPRPETLADWVAQPAQLRARLKSLPELEESRLWKVQAQAIRNLEQSFGRADPRALIQMATGSGKTFAAVNVAYRLLKFAHAKRILLLVDRGNLGEQTDKEFANFAPPDDSRKFPTLYTVQRLKTNSINSAAKVVITTIQRLYSMLKGETEFDAGNEEGSAFDTARPWQGEPPDVVYNAGIPPEFFDFIIVDECHRSIYELWSQVVLYFDAFLIGLTATPAGKTIGFFNQNLVMQYGHDEAVSDGVNVDFDVYRIRTRITEQGAVIAAGDAGVYVDMRHKLTRAERLQWLNQDLTYTANQLDRDVVSESQIRTVLQQFRDKVLPDAFPGRNEVPKTLIFAKDDSHADDIVRIAREVFAAGNDFCQKITYRTGFTKRTIKVKNDDGSESEVTDWVKTSSLTPVAEIDSGYFGGYVKPTNHVENRRDRRLSENQSGKRKAVVVIRERGGNTVPGVFPTEGHALAFIQSRIEKGTVINADESPSWNSLNAYYEMKRINHLQAYSANGACTNWAELFYSRMRRAEIGHHHHVAGPYLIRYAQEMAWREDNRRMSNGEQVDMISGLAMKRGPSAYRILQACGLSFLRPWPREACAPARTRIYSLDFCGYWQRTVVTPTV